jgi:hypothetical protein
MLDQQIVALARKTAGTELKDRDRPLALSVASCRRSRRGRGDLHLCIIELYVHEVAARAHAIWRNLHRAHNSFGSQIADTLRADLVEAFRADFESTMAHLWPRFEADMKDAPQSAKDPSWVDQLTVARHREAERCEAEIEHYVASLEAARARGAPAASYVFQGSIGAVLTGQGAVANVVQSINPDQREALLEALQLVRQAIGAAPEFEERSRRELTEFADEAAGELRKESPNTLRLSLTLQTLAAAVQGIASAPGAYQALRAAAAAIGIPV